MQLVNRNTKFFPEVCKFNVFDYPWITTMHGAADNSAVKLRQIRWLLGIVIFGLLLSGATALPLSLEVSWLTGISSQVFGPASVISQWLGRVDEALRLVDSRYPFLAYGTDWLAFGHFAIAIAFIGPFRDPVKKRMGHRFRNHRRSARSAFCPGHG
jgi:hypothetical protein